MMFSYFDTFKKSKEVEYLEDIELTDINPVNADIPYEDDMEEILMQPIPPEIDEMLDETKRKISL